jgi:uncharacterized integral membrane protein
MHQIEKHFNDEKNESLLFILVAFVAVGFAIYYLTKIKLPFYTGMSYPFIVVAFLQIVVGTSVYFRSPKDIARVHEKVLTDKSKIKTEEIPRMQVVMKKFDLYRGLKLPYWLLVLYCFFIFN